MPADILDEPAVKSAGWCNECGWSAPDPVPRVRKAAEALLVSEMESLDGPHYGPTQTVTMPPCPKCAHAERFALSVWWDERGLCYYARKKRDATWEGWPE